MVVTTKPAEKAVGAGQAKGGELLQNKTPKNAEWLAKTEKLRDNKLVGGTIVQYQPGTCLEVRDKIREISIEEDRIWIKTEGGNDWIGDTNTYIIDRNGVLNLDGPYCGNPCLIAAAGVKIPRTNSLLEVLDEIRAQKKTGDGAETV